MPILSIRSMPLVLLTSVLALTSISCSSNLSGKTEQEENSVVASAEDSLTAAVELAQTSEQVSTSDTQQVSSVDSKPAGSNLYRQAIERASSAFVLSQSAQSQDDWSLVARRWQQAIDLMASVPTANPNHAQAQSKVVEYRNNLNYAKQQANRSTTAGANSGRVIIRSQPASPVPRSATVTTAPPPVAAAARPPVEYPAPANPTNSQRSFYAPIVRREGNTPVIKVVFNGSQAFDMIVDTGASGTLITQRMAETLGVVPVAATMVDTASERGVVVPLGYVTSMEVNGAAAQNVMVAIAGPQLGTGLLGHDFFGNYDIVVREHEVVFRER